MDFGLGGLDEEARASTYAALRAIRAEAGDFQEKPPPETVGGTN
jgi:hypothetical protein